MVVEMKVTGLMVDPLTNMPIVVLKNEETSQILPIWVGIFEANAIALQMENISTPRPMTHDLLRHAIEDLGGTVTKIVIADLRDNTFYALIHVDTQGGPIAIDARPSDAIALALRTQASIFVEDSVIDSAKGVDFATDRGDSERLQKWLESLDPEELGKYKM